MATKPLVEKGISTLAAAVARDYQTVALVLQGGGALGAYQAGVYEALTEAGVQPNWVAGISIGALNAAIIAGNAPSQRVERLREFWETICRPPWQPAFAAACLPLAWQSGISSVAGWRALTEGQPGFFRPRLAAWLPQASPATTSWYDTAALRTTLERLVDFDRVNDARSMRVSVGAVNVRCGNFVYFDNTHDTLRAEHFMASGALPPGFPAVEIDGEFYWDGGVVSNTPLYQVLGERSCHGTLAFQVDLWSAHGKLPHDLAGVAERRQEIQYSSRTRLITDYMRHMQEHACLLQELMALVPESRRSDPAWRRAESHAATTVTNVIHLIYQDKPYEGHHRAYDFSTTSMHGHWHSGLRDMRNTLAHPQWLAVPDPAHPFVTHDVHRANAD